MNGLDLTPWIEETGTAYSDWESLKLAAVAMVVLSAIVTLASMVKVAASISIAGDRWQESEDEAKSGLYWLGVLLVSIIVIIGGIAWGNTLDGDEPESRFDYIAQHYGISDLDCDADWESKDERYDCRMTITAPDMDTLSTAEPTRELTLIIRDNCAYLYNEDGNLMEVKQ